MRTRSNIRLLLLAASGVLVFGPLGCDSQGGGSVSINISDDVAVVCGGGIIRHGNASVELNGVYIQTQNEVQYSEAELVIWDDANDNGVQDEGETVYFSSSTNIPGTTWQCGTVLVEWGARRKVPKVRVRVVTVNGEVNHTQDLPTGATPLSSPDAADAEGTIVRPLDDDPNVP
ncbi:MAG: hypothetical protein HRF50_02815 [Phycisphaerae bacterium]|jgi:hypothetical protein